MVCLGTQCRINSGELTLGSTPRSPGTPGRSHLCQPAPQALQHVIPQILPTPGVFGDPCPPFAPLSLCPTCSHVTPANHKLPGPPTPPHPCFQCPESGPPTHPLPHSVSGKEGVSQEGGQDGGTRRAGKGQAETREGHSPSWPRGQAPADRSPGWGSRDGEETPQGPDDPSHPERTPLPRALPSARVFRGQCPQLAASGPTGRNRCPRERSTTDAEPRRLALCWPPPAGPPGAEP